MLFHNYYMECHHLSPTSSYRLHLPFLVHVFVPCISRHRLRSRHSKASSNKASSSLSSSSTASMKSLKPNTTQLAASIPEGNTIADGNSATNADGSIPKAVGKGSSNCTGSGGSNVNVKQDEDGACEEQKEEKASDRYARVAQELRDWLEKLRMEHWAPKFEVRK